MAPDVVFGHIARTVGFRSNAQNRVAVADVVSDGNGSVPDGADALNTFGYGMVSVLLLCRYDRLGASSRLRFLDFVKPLAARGIEVTPLPLVDDGYLRAFYAGHLPNPLNLAAAYAKRLAALLEIHRFDVVWLEKEALPWLPAWIETRLLNRASYVMDIDDAWYLRYDTHRLVPVRRLLDGKFTRLARGADVVVAGNRHLAAWAAASGARDIEVLPTVIDIDRYTVTPAATRRPPVVGWMGSPSSAGYLGLVMGAFARLGDRVRFRVVGAGDACPSAGVSVERVAWSEETEIAELNGFDIGIMPLADGPWERGKCGYKLIQYMAAARPVVASPVGINMTLVRDGENGFLAGDEDAWVRAIERLISEDGLRVAMGAAGRRLVESGYTLQSVLPRLEAVLRRAAEKRRNGSKPDLG